MTSPTTNAADPGPTRRLARFAAQLEYGRLPQAVRDALTVFLLDYVRVASLGERAPWSGWATEWARALGGRPSASMLFSGERTDPERATFVNATYAGSIDADDVHVGAMLHPGCVAIPAALAIAEVRGANGASTLAAIAAGYETMIRIALALQPSHFRRGFQSTATCGGFGAATAAARLLFGNAEPLRRSEHLAATLGLVASFSGGLTQFYHSGSTVKRIHAAHAAREGLHAALLAAAGFDGPADILEGRDGYARAYADGHDFERALAGLGEDWRLLETAVKPHACSARVLAAIEATALLCREHGIDADAVRSIRVGIPSVIQGRLTVAAPCDVQAAQMSLPYCVAMVLARGRDLAPGFSLTVEDFEAAMTDERIAGLAHRIERVPDSDVERVSTERSVGARVTIEFAAGTVALRVERLVEAPQGSASRPYTFDDHVERFRLELGRRYPAHHVEALLAEIRGYAQAHGPQRLIALLTRRD